MNGEESVKCPICGKKMRLFDALTMSRGQKKAWTCYGCGLHIPEESAEKVMEALAEKNTDTAYPPGTEVALGIEATACDAIEAKIRDMWDTGFDVQQMLADTGNLYEPILKAGPENPRYRGWFDRMVDISMACKKLAEEVGNHAHGLHSDQVLLARAKMKKPEGEE